MTKMAKIKEYNSYNNVNHVFTSTEIKISQYHEQLTIHLFIFCQYDFNLTYSLASFCRWCSLLQNMVANARTQKLNKHKLL